MNTRAATALVAVLGVVVVSATGASTGAAEAQCVIPRGKEQVRLDPADFTTRITNPWWPMRVGARWVYRETAPDGTRQHGVVTVLRKTKVVADGVTARVVHDVATEAGVPIEITDDWYAQDRCGNVWYLGEATTEYENGKPVSTEGSFEAGVDGAQPGVIVPAHPKSGMSYRQEYYKGHAEDMAEVAQVGTTKAVALGQYSDVIVIKEWNPLEPDVVEQKYYAPGVGVIAEETLKGGDEKAELTGT